jgi:hypothetical protein
VVSATAKHIMSEYRVMLDDRIFNPVLSLPDVRIVPTHWGASATGGPEYAILDVYGPEAALWNCLDWLRYGVEIINGHGPGGLVGICGKRGAGYSIGERVAVR